MLDQPAPNSCCNSQVCHVAEPEARTDTGNTTSYYEENHPFVHLCVYVLTQVMLESLLESIRAWYTCSEDKSVSSRCYWKRCMELHAVILHVLIRVFLRELSKGGEAQVSVLLSCEQSISHPGVHFEMLSVETASPFRKIPEELGTCGEALFSTEKRAILFSLQNYSFIFS